MGLIIFIIIMVVAIAAIIALAFPKSAPGQWIAQAFKDVYAFLYTEIGTVLTLLKYPVPGSSPTVYKFSSKRLTAIGLIANVIANGVPSGLFHIIFDGGELAIAGLFLWYAAKTKT